MSYIFETNPTCYFVILKLKLFAKCSLNTGLSNYYRKTQIRSAECRLKGEYNDIPTNIDQGAETLYIGKSPKYRAATFHLDDLYIFNRALSADDIVEIKDGQLLPVEPKDKLTTTWGKLKTHRD